MGAASTSSVTVAAWGGGEVPVRGGADVFDAGELHQPAAVRPRDAHRRVCQEQAVAVPCRGIREVQAIGEPVQHRCGQRKREAVGAGGARHLDAAQVRERARVDDRGRLGIRLQHQHLGTGLALHAQAQLGAGIRHGHGPWGEIGREQQALLQLLQLRAAIIDGGTVQRGLAAGGVGSSRGAPAAQPAAEEGERGGLGERIGHLVLRQLDPVGARDGPWHDSRGAGLP